MGKIIYSHRQHELIRRVHEFPNDICDFSREKTIQEAIAEVYVDFLVSDAGLNALRFNRQKDIHEFNSQLIYDKNASDVLKYTLEDAQMASYSKLIHFVTDYKKNPDNPYIFLARHAEALKIYGLLDNKEDIANFPRLLLNIFNCEAEEKEPDYSKLNRYPEILRKSGVKKETDFEEKFSYLKAQFNNFETEADKIEAMEYVVKSYDDKIRLINSPDAKQIHSRLSDIVDYLYFKTGGQNLENFSQYVDLALDFNNLKSNSLRQAEADFGEFNEIENKINFLEILAQSDVSIAQYNEFPKSSCIEGLNTLDYVVNKSAITENIKDKDINYSNLCPVLNALYIKAKDYGDTDTFKSGLEILEQNKIKDSASFLKFYNQICHSKVKSLTQEEVYNLFELLNYSFGAKLYTRKDETAPIEFLKNNKQEFLEYKLYIEEFLKTTTNEYFISKTPLEVYKQCRDFVDFKNPNAMIFLDDFRPMASDGYISLRAEVEKLRSYFDKNEKANDFIIENKIKFDDFDDSKKYRNACLKILELLKDDENFDEKIEYLSKSGFLLKSKDELCKFTEEFEKSGKLKEILDVIIEKQVPDTKRLNHFFKKYINANNEKDNLITFLKLSPIGVDFSACERIIDRLSNLISSLEMPVNINNDNILSIDISKFLDKKTLKTSEFNDLMCSLLNMDDKGSFIDGLSATYTNCAKYFSRYKIAQELASKIEKSRDSYNNIIHCLKLDKESLGLDEDCTINEYISAIQSKIPDEFMKFINSSDWLDIYHNKEYIPNLALHARLRLIERFALDKYSTIEDLDDPLTVYKVQTALKSIYTQKPTSIEGREESHRILIRTPYYNGRIESIFSNQGELITLFITD